MSKSFKISKALTLYVGFFSAIPETRRQDDDLSVNIKKSEQLTAPLASSLIDIHNSWSNIPPDSSLQLYQ